MMGKFSPLEISEAKREEGRDIDAADVCLTWLQYTSRRVYVGENHAEGEPQESGYRLGSRWRNRTKMAFRY